MDIEAVPKEYIFAKKISNAEEIDEQSLSQFLNMTKEVDAKKLVEFLRALYRLSVVEDATMIEINPFIYANGKIVCLDSKISIDDNSHYRHKKVFENHDYDDLNPSESKAKTFDINYIGLDGNIACLVNGAGLAMATMDLIKLKGGCPANFLDIGGGATADQVAAAIDIIGQNRKVDVIYVNIFGGIMRCDIIAEGIIRAAKKLRTSIPFVIRLKGNNLEKAKSMLKDSGIEYRFEDDYELSAAQAVKLASK